MDGKRPGAPARGAPPAKRAAAPPPSGPPPPPGPPPPTGDEEEDADVYDADVGDDDVDAGAVGEEVAVDVALGEAGRNWVRPPPPPLDAANDEIGERMEREGGEGRSVWFLGAR